jgi:hypothetical protein
MRPIVDVWLIGNAISKLSQAAHRRQHGAAERVEVTKGIKGVEGQVPTRTAALCLKRTRRNYFNDKCLVSNDVPR